MPDDGNLVEPARMLLNDTFKKLGAEKDKYSKWGRWLKRWNTFFNASTVLLSVVAPALVTYQTQQSGGGDGLTFVAIAFVGVAGAAATLRTVFRFSERFGYTTLTGLALQELESNSRLDLEDMLNSAEGVDIHSKLSDLNRNTQRVMNEIIKAYIEREVAAVEKAETRSIAATERGQNKRIDRTP